MNEADAETVRSLAGTGPSEADLKAARANGEDAGADLARMAGENPYSHNVFDLRTAWFEGFSAGRVRGAGSRGEAY